MTEPEDQLRAYAAALARVQRPVDIDEVVSRRRHARLPVARAAVALVAAVVVAGTIVVVTRGHGGPSRVVVAPGVTSTTRTTRTTPSAPADCAAAALAVTSTRGETLHPGWLPPGYVLRNGSETELGSSGYLEYSTPTGGDRPRVQISRDLNSLPLANLYAGTPRPTTVQGHPAILSVGSPIPIFTALLWRPLPGVALIVNGYKLPEADLRKVAENLHYEPGATFTYPAHPEVTVTREQALAALAGSSADKQAVLTSLGEISAVAGAAAGTDVRKDLAPSVSVTEPVWVVWARTGPPPYAADVDDAQSGDSLFGLTSIGSRPLDALTDRSRPGCAPPFGVLTRSEATFIERPTAGVTTIMKLATQGTIDKYEHIGECDPLHPCDSTVPIWLVVQIATDHRFDEEIPGPPGRSKITKAGSFSVTMLDARTGLQTTNFGGELGPGRPPAHLLEIPDLEP